MVCIYNGESFSHKEEFSSAICRNMEDLETIKFREISQTYVLYVFPNMWNRKKMTEKLKGDLLEKGKGLRERGWASNRGAETSKMYTSTLPNCETRRRDGRKGWGRKVIQVCYVQVQIRQNETL